MSLLTDWRKVAYETERTPRDNDLFWGNYFNIEKGIYSQILAQNGTPVTGTVKALTEKFETKIGIMTGFLDGINDSLKTPNPIEEMTEDTEVSLDYDPEKLYYNMVAAKADWLYGLAVGGTAVCLSDLSGAVPHGSRYRRRRCRLRRHSADGVRHRAGDRRRPSEERRKELYKEQKASGTVHVEKKPGRNDPCPCGSGKKYKFCCGKKA